MLIEFRVENHRSLREEQALSFVAGRGGDPDDPRPRHPAGANEPILPVVAIYGANASGKSNVLTALAFVYEAVTRSHRSWAPEGGVRREPFAWGAPDAPSLFELTFLVDGTRFEYGFTTDGRVFLEEWLYAWPQGHKQVWFERDRQEMKFGEKLKGENRVIEQVTRPNALFLSAAAQLHHEQLRPVYRWISNLQGSGEQSVGWATSWGRTDPTASSALVGPDPTGARRERLLTLLRATDACIVDAKVLEETEPGFPRSHLHVAEPRRRRVFLLHAGAEDAWLPLEAESQGTQALFHLGGPLLDVLERGGILAIDELERSLHPLLAQRIVQQFNDPALNPKNAQLLFTTHDTNLLGTVLGEPALRRDQVWLTEKDKDGATHLYPLSDYQPRKQENVERGYLQGRYGAIPFLGPLVEAKAPE